MKRRAIYSVAAVILLAAIWQGLKHKEEAQQGQPSGTVAAATGSGDSSTKPPRLGQASSVEQRLEAAVDYELAKRRRILSLSEEDAAKMRIQIKEDALKANGGNLQRATAMLTFDKYSAVKAPITAEEARDYLSKIQPTVEDYIGIAFAALDATLLEEGLSRYPDSGELLLASLLFDSRYLADQQGIEELARQMPESAWPDLMLARQAIQTGDIDAVAKYLAASAEGTFTSYQQLVQDSMAKYVATQGLESRRTELVYDIPAAFEPLILRNMMTSIYGELHNEFNKNAATMDAAQQQQRAALFHGALAAAEQWTADSTFTWEKLGGAGRQLSLLERLDPEFAENTLNIPYAQRTAELEAEIKRLRVAHGAVQNLQTTLTGAELASFQSLVKQLGEVAAIEKQQAGPR